MEHRIRMQIAIRLIAAALLVLAGTVPSRASDAQTGVAELLTRSAAAWNHGDLDAFMTSYERSPQTVYIGAKRIEHGYAAIRAHYAAHYRAGRMGTLSVSDLAVRDLGPGYAAATARWHLARPASNGGNVSGLFTLVLHRGAGGWHIISDHTP